VRRLIACIDEAEPSAAVLRCACSLAEPEGEVVVLHVAPSDPDFLGYDVGPPTVRDGVAKSLRDARRGVQELASKAARPGVSVTALTVQGPVVDRILEHAERLASQLIVVGTKRHGALHELVLGSVVHNLLGRSPIPVVVVPNTLVTP
jgi:nucleotide-binding universal stress UspA family protein